MIGDSLRYFQSSKQKETLYSIPLIEILEVKKIKAGMPGIFSFKVIVKDKDPLVLRATKLNDAKKWVAGLRLQVECWKAAERKRHLNGNGDISPSKPTRVMSLDVSKLK